ncbi:MAG TPA: polysaccharide biosynthesis tyrosine autokinase [Pyrinomonadaceae bacterium]|nr:polysaccharide biosynthesis tyrosine autokinase [Pyrinomonadaceae bacterium]
MEQDQRLTPLPKTGDLKTHSNDYPATYPAYYEDDTAEGRRSLQQYINVVYKRLPIILILTLLTTAVATLYMFRQPSLYSATTQMVIEPRRPKAASKDSININFGNDVNYYNTQLRLLKNPDLMRDVVIRLGLYADKDGLGDDGGLMAGLRSMFSSEKSKNSSDALPVIGDVPQNPDGSAAVQLTPEEKSRADLYAAQLAGRLSVEQQERTNLVNVTMVNTDPKLAANVADKVAEVFIEQDASREVSSDKQVLDDLTKSIDELRGTIATQEAGLIEYMRSHELPLQDKGQDLAASRLQSMSETWLKAMENRRLIETRYNLAVQAGNSGKGMSIPDIYENKVFQDTMRLNTERKAKLQDQIRDIDKHIQEAETEKAELLVKYTPEYFKVKEKEERIASLKAAREKTEREVTKIIDTDQAKLEKNAVGGALAVLRSQLESARKQEAQAQAVYEREAALANVQGQAVTELTTKKREIETNRTLLDQYTQRQKEQELKIASGRPDNIKIAAHAVAPSEPFGPNRLRNIMVALIASLGAGIGLAFLMDYLDDSVKTSDDIGRHLGLPTLALIPHYFGSEKKRLRLAAANGNGNGAGTALITLEERNSPMAEAYRHLRTSLLFSSAGKPPQSILVTSSQPSEGKTTTAINTAVTLAQSGADVVIVDCDLRRPRLHSYFELENSQGLTNYLSGERNTENLIKPCRDLPQLKVITSGPIPPNPAELLSSNEMKNLLQFLRGRYKHVVIDSPPAISFTDAAILSTQVDGVVLVAMAGKSSIHLMRRFKHRLANLGARIYGVVLNGIKADSYDYEYSGYYSYYSKPDDDPTPDIEEMGVGKSITDITR